MVWPGEFFSDNKESFWTVLFVNSSYFGVKIAYFDVRIA